MASRCLSLGDSTVSEDVSDVKKDEKTNEEDACTMIMRRVVVRSSGIGPFKRAWTKPPREVGKPHKPTVADQLGLIAYAAAVAAATGATTALGGSPAPFNPRAV
jgi:hypothetical protein